MFYINYLKGIDRYNFYGTVSLGTRNLAEELLKAGLAKYVDWSGSKSAFAEKLKAAEKYNFEIYDIEN